MRCENLRCGCICAGWQRSGNFAQEAVVYSGVPVAVQAQCCSSLPGLAACWRCGEHAASQEAGVCSRRFKSAGCGPDCHLAGSMAIQVRNAITFWVLLLFIVACSILCISDVTRVLLPCGRDEVRRRAPAERPDPHSKLKAAISRMEGGAEASLRSGHRRGQPARPVSR